MQVPPLLVAALAGLVAMPASAAMQSFDITINNTGNRVLACDASIAHWFSEALGEIPPGQALHFTLYTDPDNGTVFLRNTVGDDMPLQRLWCGLKGKSWATRSDIALERRAGHVPSAIVLDCAARDSKTHCTLP